MIEFQRQILADRVRNAALVEALKRVIVPGKTTLADLGSGTGFLAFVASRLGAKRCWLYEMGETLELSRAIAKQSGISNCTFVRAHSQDVEDPPQVDVVMSETLGNFALEEGILETLRDARRFLKPGGTLIPQKLRQRIAPVVAPRLRGELDVWGALGFELDFTPARAVGLNNVYVRGVRTEELLQAKDAAQTWDDLDFREAPRSVRTATVEWPLARATTVHGFAVWWECELIDGLVLSTDPAAPATHWEQVFLPLLEPVEAKAGETLRIELKCDARREVKINLEWRTSLIDRGGRARVQTRQDMRKGWLE